MDDARSRPPKTDVVLGTRAGQKIVDLFVDILSSCQVLFASDLRFDQMVTMDCSGGSDGRHPSRHELEDRHLGRGILTCDPVRSKLQI